MFLFFEWLAIFILLFYLIFKTTHIFNHVEIKSKLNCCFAFNISHFNSYTIYNTLTVNTIVYDERIKGYRIFGIGQVKNFIYLECLVFSSYKNSKCISYIKQIITEIMNGFVIYIIVKKINFIPKFVMINEYCFALPIPDLIRKRLYEYTVCTIPDSVERDEKYEKLWVNYNRRIGIEKIVIYKYQNSTVANTNDNLLDIIEIDVDYLTDAIMNDCFYRYRLLSKSILFMKMSNIILFLKNKNEMKLNNVINKQNRESNDLLYLCRCKSVEKSKNVSFNRLSKQKLKCENRNACSFAVVNNPLKFSYITQNGCFSDYWFYSETKLQNHVIILETE